MISDPDLVLYTCIAHTNTNDSPESTILAEFNSADSVLHELAQQCLLFAPPHHTNFSQTFRNRTFTFLLDYPFIYFGIFDPKMMKLDQLNLLDCLKEILIGIIGGNFDQKFTSYCLQGELDPMFRKLLSKSLDFDGGDHNVDGDSKISVSSFSGSSKGKKIMTFPMLNCCKIGVGLKKKRMSGDSVTGSDKALMDGKVDVFDDNVGVGEIKSRDIVCQNGHRNDNVNGNGNVGRQKAKKIWRRHVWIVLMLDLAVCLILFGIWLFVCRGFECVED